VCVCMCGCVCVCVCVLERFRCKPGEPRTRASEHVASEMRQKTRVDALAAAAGSPTIVRDILC
jgi:hypothetical protein